MKLLVYAILFACMLLFLPGSAESPDKAFVVNLMIDADVPPMPSERQGYESEVLLNALLTEITSRDLGATIFSTRDTLGTYNRMRLTKMGKNPDFELAMSGNGSNEMLSTKSYSEQKAVLEESKTWTEACKYCGINEINVTGFMPPNFDQNSDTYRVLDELKIRYNAGFQSGLIYEKEHENDVWPYKVDGHDFYAVPISTYEISGELVPLQDKYFNESGLSSTQWYDALAEKYEEAKNNNQPMVIVLTSSVSGSGDYLDALKRFLDFARDASFVTTMDLVDMALPDGLQIAEKSNEVCTTCGQQNNITITLDMENLTPEEPMSKD